MPEANNRSTHWCHLVALAACALAVAVAAFNGAERSRSAVAVLDVIGPSDAPHCALALTAKTLAAINIPNVTRTVRIVFVSLGTVKI
jgi:hypothetical protein